MSSVRERYGEAFWRAHHEAWLQSELNQREYCEAYGIPIKAFGNWRARFKAEPHPPARKVLYRSGRCENVEIRRPAQRPRVHRRIPQSLRLAVEHRGMERGQHPSG
jgi:hypothetical protein